MGLHSDVREAVNESRDELIGVLASYNTIPVEDEEVETANLLGGDTAPDFEFERQDGAADEEHTLDRQTRKLAVEKLGIDSLDDCEAVQDEIRNHADYSA